MVAPVTAAVESATVVDAVDLLDASFHNLTTVDENKVPPQQEFENNHKNNANNDNDRDEDFEAFVCSTRLKEREEFEQSIHKIEKNPVTDVEKVQQRKELAAIAKGLDPTLVVTETKPNESLSNNSSNNITYNPKRFVSPKDFELLKVIGMGAFGKVLQVRNKKSKQILAMKVISKRLLNRKSGYVENIQAERNILTRVKHPFVVMMHASFQTRFKLFIIMDFLAGGELFLRLGREGIFLEKTAAFYLSEIILALEFLHNLGVLHRDLKPENILLGEDGHVCLTDFGLAKDFSESGGFANEEDESRASTICGTQEYMAPEMIARKGYGRAADYWSLGCIAYEMLNGLPPFRSKLGAKDLFRKIMSEKVKMPDGSSAAACKLLKGLLNRTPHLRLGAARSTMFEIGGTSGLKKMEFFKSIDWEMLERKEMEPPERLFVQDQHDLKHFHDEFTTMPLPRSVLLESKDDFVPRHIDSRNFRGFSFIQDGFLLPDRNDDEIEQYWNSADEDAESVSECASSKYGVEPAAPVEPDNKKRPPRKRKKKNKVADVGANAMSVASTGDGGLTPLQSGDEAEPAEKLETVNKTSAVQSAPSTEPPVEVKRNPANQPSTAPAVKESMAPEHSTKPTPPAKVVTTKPVAAKPVSQLPNAYTWQSKKGGATANTVKQQPQAFSLDPTRNQKYTPPPRRGVPSVNSSTPGWNQQQRQHYQQQSQPAQRNTGWTVAHQSQHPNAASPQVLSNQNTTVPNPRNGHVQPSWNTVAPAPARGPTPGSWAAKISGQKPAAGPSQQGIAATPARGLQQASRPAAPPPPPTSLPTNAQIEIPPSPSSDWREHTMPASPRKIAKAPDSWPGLGDFPPPPNLGRPKTAPKGLKPQGAWAARK